MLTRHPEHLHQVVAEVQQLLQRHRVLSTMARRQESAPSDRRDLLEILQERQNLAELERKLGLVHPADLAHILEVLPHDERRLLWDHVSASQRGLVLVELSGPIRSSLIEWLPPGVAVPLGLQRAGRDPAQGASVLLTFITDCMGFFLFLGLATAFLV